MITWENYEEYIMMHADGELQPAEEQELMEFLYAHPELQSELATYQMIKMTPDTEVVYEEKESLLREEPAKKAIVVAFPAWKKYAIAAGIAALMILTFVKLTDNSNKTITGVAATDTVHRATPAIPTQEAPKTEMAATTLAQPAAEEHESKTNNEGIAQQQAHRTTVKKQTNPIPAKAPAHMLAEVRNTNREQIESISPAGAQQLPLAPTKPAALAVKDVPAYAMAENNETQKESFLSRLPIEETKKQGIEHVVATLSDKVNDIKRGVNSKALSVKLEKRKLTLSF